MLLFWERVTKYYSKYMFISRSYLTISTACSKLLCRWTSSSGHMTTNLHPLFERWSLKHDMACPPDLYMRERLREYFSVEKLQFLTKLVSLSNVETHMRKTWTHRCPIAKHSYKSPASQHIKNRPQYIMYVCIRKNCELLTPSSVHWKLSVHRTNVKLGQKSRLSFAHMRYSLKF